MEQLDVYEPPVVAEIGDFAELTRGYTYGEYLDGYYGWYYGVGARS